MENTPQAQLHNFIFLDTFHRMMSPSSCHGVGMACLIIKIEYCIECERMDNLVSLPWMFSTDLHGFMGRLDKLMEKKLAENC